MEGSLIEGVSGIAGSEGGNDDGQSFAGTRNRRNRYGERIAGSERSNNDGQSFTDTEPGEPVVVGLNDDGQSFTGNGTEGIVEGCEPRESVEGVNRGKRGVMNRGNRWRCEPRESVEV